MKFHVFNRRRDHHVMRSVSEEEQYSEPKMCNWRVNPATDPNDFACRKRFLLPVTYLSSGCRYDSKNCASSIDGEIEEDDDVRAVSQTRESEAMPECL